MLTENAPPLFFFTFLVGVLILLCDIDIIWLLVFIPREEASFFNAQYIISCPSFGALAQLLLLWYVEIDQAWRKFYDSHQWKSYLDNTCQKLREHLQSILQNLES
eukprot:TRINITY_DN19960_c0_g1_i1.p5 TRINITY_DN19960_c0_g1~~TRINITY_DN19960_c0_g1_i1.p5  ORF type:complete len:105 (+),score=8.74 TRINITY_DN19960_c0_g1_i1:515-829(+)